MNVMIDFKENIKITVTNLWWNIKQEKNTNFRRLTILTDIWIKVFIFLFFIMWTWTEHVWEYHVKINVYKKNTNEVVEWNDN